MTGGGLTPPALVRLLALGVLLATAVGAQTASLVKNLQPDPEPGRHSANPTGLFPAAGKLFFFLPGPPGGAIELWVTDGSAHGTGPISSLSVLNSFVRAGQGLVFFVAAGERREPQLWRTDGTRPGTFPLTGPGLELERNTGPAIVGGRVFFSGCTAELGCELWASDGSRAGTRLVRDLLPGSTPLNGPVALTPAARQVFFLLTGELWRSDGTAAGTRRLRPRGNFPDLLTAAGNRLYFTLDAGRGVELWVSDGTPAGTRPLTDFAPLQPFSITARWLRGIGGRVYFNADDGLHGNELWVSDGTPQGTRRVTDFAAPLPFSPLLYAEELAEVGGRLVFPASDGVSPRQLWTTGGSPASTAPLCSPGSCPQVQFSTTPSPLARVGERLLFAGFDAGHGAEVWATDGTAQGTSRLADLCRGTCSGVRSEVRAAAGAAFFVASRRPGGDEELWVSDGTPAGTRRFLEPGLRPARPLELANAGNTLYFAAGDEAHGTELWASDGPPAAPAAPRLVADLGRSAAGSLLESLEPLGDRLLFTACPPEEESQLWISDGAEDTTVPVPGVPATSDFGCPPNAPRELTVAGGTGYFWLERDQGDLLELWRTDGTAAGSRRAAGLPFSVFARIPALAPLGNRVLFGFGTTLWTSDGTPAGTVPLLDLPGAPGSFATLGSQVFFSLGLTDTGQIELWRSDGTAGGTRRLAEGRFDFTDLPAPALCGAAICLFANPDAIELWRTDGTTAGTARVGAQSFGFARPSPLVELGGALYFLAGTEEGQQGLWRTDGTADGTRLVRELPPVSDAPLTALAGRLFFPARDEDRGEEIWRSDGTGAGTIPLADLVPGPDSSFPRQLTAAGGKLFFTAADRDHGVEPWRSDGTAEGTRRIQDLFPGRGSSRPEQLTPAGRRLFFVADDGATGRELWVLPLDAGPGCQPSATRLCLNGGRFQVEVAWQDFGGGTGAGTAVPLTAGTGYFWFFDAANVELVVKVLDAEPLNGHFWVFYGALSSVEYTLTVTDTRTGAARRYTNPAGQLASVGDTRAFGPLGAFSQTPAPAASALVLVAERSDPAATAPCQPGPRRLCLQRGRFAVEARWKDFQGGAGEGTAVGLTGDTGYFWFFDAANVEVVLKVLDGRGLNGKFWVFYGALSNVEYTLTVTDTETGTMRTYANPSGRFASAADTGAF